MALTVEREGIARVRREDLDRWVVVAPGADVEALLEAQRLAWLPSNATQRRYWLGFLAAAGVFGLVAVALIGIFMAVELPTDGLLIPALVFGCVAFLAVVVLTVALAAWVRGLIDPRGPYDQAPIADVVEVASGLDPWLDDAMPRETVWELASVLDEVRNLREEWHRWVYVGGSEEADHGSVAAADSGVGRELRDQARRLIESRVRAASSDFEAAAERAGIPPLALLG